MKLLRSWAARLFGAFGATDRDVELAAELDSHLQLHIDDNLRAGMTPTEARRRALVALGGLDQTKERYRDRRSLPLVETVVSDLRDAWRRLRRAPGPVAAIVLTLGVALGMNAAVFAAIDALVLRPISLPQIDRLVFLSERSSETPLRQPMAPANFLDWSAQVTRLDGTAALTADEVEIGGDVEPARVERALVSSGFFDLLGARTALGRTFTREESRLALPVVVLTHRLWQRAFAGDAGVIGRSVLIDGQPHTVIGVASEAFTIPANTELWAPLVFDQAALDSRDNRTLLAVGRLADGTSLEAARAEIGSIWTDLVMRYPVENTGRRLEVQSLTEGLVEPGLFEISAGLQVAALLALIVACANITNLLLALSAERRHEVAVRLALGATRGRVLRGLWLESAWIGLFAVPVALAIAAAGTGLLRTSMPERLVGVPGWQAIDVDGRLLMLVAVLAAVSATGLGFIPAWRASAGSFECLKEAARSLTTDVGRQRLRRALVIVQVALVVPILAAAELAWRGTSQFISGPQGYEPDGVLTLRLVLPERLYPTPAAQRQFVDDLTDRFRTVQGLEHSAVANALPATGVGAERRVSTEDDTGSPIGAPALADYRVVSPAYFETLRIAVLQGRGFTDLDTDTSAPVAIVSRSLAAQHWPGQDPIGQRLRHPGVRGNPGPWMTVVGVVDDVVHDWFFRQRATLYRPFAQAPLANVALAVRTSGDPGAATSLVRKAIHQIDSQRPLADVMPMRQVLEERLTAPRQVSVSMGALGIVVLMLAVIGIHGMTSYMVTLRRHEIGVRMALGATKTDVSRLVLRQALALVLVGTVLGTGLAIPAARLFGTALADIASLDLVRLLAIVAGIVALTVLATASPTRRAAAIEPATAIRRP